MCLYTIINSRGQSKFTRSINISIRVGTIWKFYISPGDKLSEHIRGIDFSSTWFIIIQYNFETIIRSGAIKLMIKLRGNCARYKYQSCLRRFHYYLWNFKCYLQFG